MESLRQKRDEFRAEVRREEIGQIIAKRVRRDKIVAKKAGKKIDDDDLELGNAIAVMSDDYSSSSEEDKKYSDLNYPIPTDIILDPNYEENLQIQQNRIEKKIARLKELFKEILSAKSDNSLGTLTKSLVKLREYTIEHATKNHIDSTCAEFLANPSVLSILLGFLSYTLATEKELQIQTLWLMINITSTKKSTIIENLTTSKLLLTLLELFKGSSFLLIKSDILFCMTNFIVGNEKARDWLMVNELPRLLADTFTSVTSKPISDISATEQTSDEDALNCRRVFVSRCFEFIVCYLQTKPWPATGAQDMYALLLIGMKDHLTTTSIMDVMYSLQAITSNMSQDELSQPFEDSLDRYLIRILKKHDLTPRVRVAILRVLSNLSAADYPDLVKRFLDEGFLDVIVKDLLVNRTAEEMDYLLFTFSNLCICKPEEAYIICSQRDKTSAQNTVELSSIPGLGGKSTIEKVLIFDGISILISHSNKKIRNVAIKCFLNLLQCADTPLLLSMVERYANLIEVILDSLTDDRPIIELIYLLNLIKLFFKADEYQQEVKGQTFNILAKCLEFTSIHNLETLQKHHSYQVRDLTKSIVSQYFDTYEDFATDSSDPFKL